MIFARQFFRAQRGGLLGWAASLSVLTFLTTIVFPGEHASGTAALEQFVQGLPGGMKAMLGQLLPMSTLAGWLQFNIYSFIPLILSVYASIAVANVLSREMDRGTAEFLFALPVGRVRLVLERFAVVALDIALLHAVVVLSAWAGGVELREPFPLGESARVMLDSLFIVVAVAALVLLLTVFLADYGRAVFIGLGASVGLYFLSVTLRASGKAQGLLPWLVFGRFDAGAVMSTGASLPRDALVLGAYGAFGLALACVSFRRRDLRF